MNNAIVRVNPTTDLIMPPRFTFEDMRAMSEQVAKSGLFKPMDSPAILTLMLLADAEGLHPIKALMRYHIVEGRPSMRSDTMLAEFQRSGGRVEWIKDTESECEGVFYHKKHCPEGKHVLFSIKDADRAGLLKSHAWQKHPRPMLRARVITNAVRMIDPGVIMGIYTPDEIEEVHATPVEQTAHATLTARLRDRHEPVAKTVADMKAAEAAQKPPAEPQTSFRDWITGTLDGFNKQAVERYPTFKPIAANQVANHLIKWAKKDGKVTDDQLTRPDGKRDSTLVAAMVRQLWQENDFGCIQEIGNYLSEQLSAFADMDARELAGTA
jgi:hypothetical protein